MVGILAEKVLLAKGLFSMEIISMRLANQMVLASTNVHKYREFKALLAVHAADSRVAPIGAQYVELVPAESVLANADKLGFVEVHDTYLENAVAKARLCNQGCHYPCLGDDSGLEVMALEGKPGVRSRRFAAARAGVSQDQANMQALLEALTGKPDRSARFVCTLALMVEGVLVHATGILEGTIAERASGKNGFGYDPIFIPKGQTRSLAEMSDSEKNSISHRAKAVQALMVEIRARSLVLAKP